MQLLEGTSGYSYKEWKGGFYPPKTKNADMLAYYASRLPAVEINNTFYRMPKADVLAGWAAQVPPDFRFIIKAPRRITHIKRLREVSEEITHLMHMLESLEDKLGGVLFQLPPFLRLDLQRLAAFQASLPADLAATFEFRHDSWLTDAVFATLADAGHALCYSHDDAGAADAQDPPPSGPDDYAQLPAERPHTPSHAYLRLRNVEYSDAQLGAWLQALQTLAAQRAYVFFKHEDEATGPALALRLRQLHAGAGSHLATE